MVIAPTAIAYAAMQKLLLPRGKLWDLAPTSLLSAIFLAAGDELVRISARAVDLARESHAPTTSELLGDFEAQLDLIADGSEAERIARVVARLISRQRFRPTDLQLALASLLGQDAADVVIIETSAADAAATGDQEIIYLYHVYRDPALPGSYDLEGAQSLLDDISHSHTQGRACESISFICEDPQSLCDRDLIGS